MGFIGYCCHVALHGKHYQLLLTFADKTFIVISMRGRCCWVNIWDSEVAIPNIDHQSYQSGWLTLGLPVRFQHCSHLCFWEYWEFPNVIGAVTLTSKMA